jgi:hypothetical protein
MLAVRIGAYPRQLRYAIADQVEIARAPIKCYAKMYDRHVPKRHRKMDAAWQAPAVSHDRRSSSICPFDKG